MFGWRFWSLSALYALGAALLIGIPTVLIPNAFFVRMTPSGTLDYSIWLLSALLIGPLLALATLYPTPPQQPKERTGTLRTLFGFLLSFFSVGCPICNKIVVLLLGMSGAMTLFDPLRPLLGLAALLLLATTLYLRIRVLRLGCRLPAPRIQ